VRAENSVSSSEQHVPGGQPRHLPPDESSRGGLTTKIHAVVDGGVHPVGLVLSPGQAGDNPRTTRGWCRCSTPSPGPVTGPPICWPTRP